MAATIKHGGSGKSLDIKCIQFHLGELPCRDRNKAQINLTMAAINQETFVSNLRGSYAHILWRFSVHRRQRATAPRETLLFAAVHLDPFVIVTVGHKLQINFGIVCVFP